LKLTILVLVGFGIAICLLLITHWAARRSSVPSEAAPVVGGYYSVDDGEGFYRVAKVLVADSDAVHIRLFKNKFRDRPSSVDLSTLGLGTIHDPDGFGMGHMPLARRSFSAWRPVLMGIEEPVTEEELEGYLMWLDAEGGLF
jgi:hypothetical protein